MDISFATRPANETANEDYVVVSPGFVIVFDGLSTPGDLATGCIHGTPWYVRRLGGHLARCLTNEPDEPLADLLARAIAHLAASHAHTCDLGDPGTPSSTVAVVRERPSHVDYLLLADSVTLLDGPGGAQVVVDDRVDAVATHELAAARRQPAGLPQPAHHLQVQQLVLEQRRHRNRTGGYWVAAADPAAAHHAVTGTLPRDDVYRVAVLTDGAARLVDPFGLATWLSLLDLLQRHGPSALIDRVREAERSDPDGQRWPRIKRCDDATAAFCALRASQPSPS